MSKIEILVVLILSGRGRGNRLIEDKHIVEVRENSLTTSLNAVEGEYVAYASEAAGRGGVGTRSLQKFPLFGNETD